MIVLDSTRAKQILNSNETIEVLYNDSPVWIENVMDNNVARVRFLDSDKTQELPVYELVENNPVKH